ncbi:MAG: hypothetical protein AAF386_07485 [Pseudomonadota bacterium]
MKNDLRPRLGTRFFGPEIRQFLMDAGHNGDEPKLQWNSFFGKDLGASFSVDTKAEVQTIKGLTITYADYSPGIAQSLTGNSTRADVEALFGQPHVISKHKGIDGVGLQFFTADVTYWVNVVDGTVRDLQLWVPTPEDISVHKRLANPESYGAAPPSNPKAVRAFANPALFQEWRTWETLEPFLDPYMDQIETGFSIFLDHTANASANKDMAAMLDAVRVFVELVNNVNHTSEQTHDGPMIETLERDTLCELIYEVVAASGAELNPDDDITYPWRDW